VRVLRLCSKPAADSLQPPTLLQQCKIELVSTHINGCGGPAVDCSSESQLQMRDCTLQDCVGGLWLWQQAYARVRSAQCTMRAGKQAPSQPQAGGSILLPARSLVQAPRPPPQQTQNTQQGSRLPLTHKPLPRHTQTLQATETFISGGTSYAVLLDAEAHAKGSACVVDGCVHFNEEEMADSEGSRGAGQAGRSTDVPMGEAACCEAEGQPAAGMRSLIGGSMLPATAQAAAATFPPATGAFVWQPPPYKVL